MRLAIVAASSYSRSGKLPELVHAESDVELLRQRLSEPDAGFLVHVTPAERGFAEELQRLLTSLSEPLEALLFFFAGYAVVSDEGFPALVLDGERLSTLSLQRVRRLVTGASASSFVILDVATAPSTVTEVPDLLRLIDGVIAGRDAGIHLLAAHRVEEHGGPSPFGSLLALTLDWHASGEVLTPEGLFWEMQREETLFAQIPAVQLYPAATPFELLLSETARIPSAPPAPEPSPTLDGAEARADRAVAEGNLDVALAELTLALEHLGPPPTPLHPALYVKVASVLRGAGRNDDALAYYDAALSMDGVLVAALQGGAELRIAAGDGPGALALLERWVRVDPSSLTALEQSARLLGESGSWAELAALYESALRDLSDARVAVELALKLDALCRDVLTSAGRAIPSLERASEFAPDDDRVRRRLAELYDRRGDSVRALPHFLAAVRVARRAGDYRVALRLFERSNRPDGAWNAACALEVLGDADVNESLLAAVHRPEGLLPARECLTEEHWARRLLCPERDLAVSELLVFLGDALVEVGLETARRKRRFVELDPQTAQDPEKSTATLIKMLTWSAKLLGVRVPKVHVVPDLGVPFFAPPAREPTLLVSRTLGSGFEMPELAFLWSRQLVLLRPEHRAIVFFPSAAELGALLVSALSLGGLPQLPFKKLDGDAKPFARGLRRHLPKDVAPRLRTLAQDFPVREATSRIFGWARAVELAAGRAGLLACGNLELAATLTQRLPLGGLVSPESQIEELLAYSISEEYAALRERLGVLVRSK